VTHGCEGRTRDSLDLPAIDTRHGDDVTRIFRPSMAYAPAEQATTDPRARKRGIHAPGDHVTG
jgi:hypothetical protein